MGGKNLLGFVEQDGRLTGFPMNLGGIGPAPIEGILYEGSGGRVEGGLALEMACD